MKIFLHIAAAAVFMAPLQALAFECKVCHSKNPAMVRMHKALQGQGCFGCHRPGEKLMGRSGPKDRESLLKRRVTDPLCLPCHKREETPPGGKAP